MWALPSVALYCSFRCRWAYTHSFQATRVLLLYCVACHELCCWAANVEHLTLIRALKVSRHVSNPWMPTCFVPNFPLQFYAMFSRQHVQARTFTFSLLHSWATHFTRPGNTDDRILWGSSTNLRISNWRRLGANSSTWRSRNWSASRYEVTLRHRSSIRGKLGGCT